MEKSIKSAIVVAFWRSLPSLVVNNLLQCLYCQPDGKGITSVVQAHAYRGDRRKVVRSFCSAYTFVFVNMVCKKMARFADRIVGWCASGSYEAEANGIPRENLCCVDMGFLILS